MADQGKNPFWLPALLVTAGLLIVALSGTCTAGFLISMAAATKWRFQTVLGAAGICLVVGGPTIAFGACTFLLGRRLGSKKDDDKNPAKSGLSTLVAFGFLGIGGLWTLASLAFFLNGPSVWTAPWIIPGLLLIGLGSRIHTLP